MSVINKGRKQSRDNPMNVIAYASEAGHYHDARKPNNKSIQPQIIFFDDLSIYDSNIVRFGLNPWSRSLKVSILPKSDTYDFNKNDYWFDEEDQILKPIGDLNDEKFLKLKMRGVPVFPIHIDGNE